MKSKILFSALAISAAFIACNNEEIVVNDSSSTNEIVGAKLLGSGLSLGIGTGDADSRATASGWENGVDVAGVAWVTSGTPDSDQGGMELTSVGSTLYANHFYQYNNNVWSTKSNVYEGWHFAYFPYQYQKKAGQLVVEVNALPMTKIDHRADVNDNALKISAAEFLSEDNVNVADGSIDVTYDISRVVNVIKPELQISSDFTQHPDLQTIKINGVTVSDSRADKAWFYKNIAVNPSKLPTIQYKKYTQGDKKGQFILVDGKKQYDDEATLAKLNYAGLYASGALAGNTPTNTISTVIDGEDFVLDGEKTLRIFLAPVRNYTANAEYISFVVSVGGGHFDIAYTPTKDNKGNKVQLTAIQETNNKAIEKMVALLNGTFKNEDGKTRNLKTITVENNGLQAAQTIEMALGLENFTADYLIEDIDDWNDAVKLANALGEETPTFNLVDNAKVEFPEGEMNVPEMGVKIIRKGTGYAENAEMIFKNKTTWSENIENLGNGIKVVVEKTGELTVEGTLWSSAIINKGTILAGKKATIGQGERFDNHEGRVEIEYGAFVYTASGKEGIIAYNVDGTESAAKINTLIATSGNKNGHAGVNTLIIANDVTLNLNHTDEDDEDDDRYNGAVIDGSVLADMTNVAIEMNGGSIIAALNKVKNVHNVTIKGGVNTIKDVDVMGTLDVEAGSVTVDATEYTVEKTVDGNKVYEKVKNAADVNAITVEKSATLNVTVDTYTSDIVNNGTINVTDPYVLRYANSIEQSGSQSGKIVQGSIDLAAAIAAGGEITLMKNETLTEQLVVTNSVSINLNGKTLTTSTTGTQNDIEIQAGGKLTVENGNVMTNATAFQTKNGGELVLNDCIVTTAGTDKWNAVGANTGKLTINGGKFVTNGGVDDSYAIGIVDAEANINGAEVSGRGAIAVHKINGEAKLTIDGGTYNGYTYYGIFVNGGEVNFDNTAVIEGTTADIYVSAESKINGETKAAASKINL